MRHYKTATKTLHCMNDYRSKNHFFLHIVITIQLHPNKVLQVSHNGMKIVSKGVLFELQNQDMLINNPYGVV